MNTQIEEPSFRAIAEVAKSVDAEDSQAKSRAIAVLNELGATDDEVVLKLSPQEHKDLQALEKKFLRGQRESIAALREIRDRKLYRETFATFDDYMASRWQRTRQWATLQLAWLRRTELLEANGKFIYHLGVNDVRVLAPLEDDADLYVRAIEEAEDAARVANKKRTTKTLEVAVRRMIDFQSARTNLAMPDLAYDEHMALSRLGISRQTNPNLVEAATTSSETESRPLRDCLADVCRSRHALPADKQLLAVVRGTELAALVEPLGTLRAEWNEQEKLREKQRTLEEERDESDGQLVPPGAPNPQGNQVAWPTSQPSVAAATEGGEEEESEEETGPACRVLLTGAFEELAKTCWWEGDAEMELDASSLPELLAVFAEKIGEGFEIREQSSITVTPLVNENADEEREDEGAEELEEELDEDEAGDE